MSRFVVFILAVGLFALAPAVARADLSATLSALNVEAKADLGDFQVRLSSHFGIPVPQVRSVFKVVPSPADAFMCLQLSLWSGFPHQHVLDVYRANRNAGWGKIAQQLGIKPGSAQFHALKRGEFSFGGGHGKGASPGKNQGKGAGGHPGKGQGKGKH